MSAVDREGMGPSDLSPEELAEIQAGDPMWPPRPAPPPIPVRGRWYITECESCGWIGSSEQCGDGGGPDHDDIVCPVCCLSMAGDSPSEADTAKHGEAVYQRITAAQADVARLSAEVEARDKRIAELSETWTDETGSVWSPPTAWAYAKTCAALDRRRAEAEAFREGLDAAEACLSIVEPRTDRAEYMRTLGVVRAALSRTDKAESRERGE